MHSHSCQRSRTGLVILYFFIQDNKTHLNILFKSRRYVQKKRKYVSNEVRSTGNILFFIEPTLLDRAAAVIGRDPRHAHQAAKQLPAQLK